MSRNITFTEASQHRTKDDLWLVIHDQVYDVSKFMDEHPYVWSRDEEQHTSAMNPTIRFSLTM